jgi:hypothetical protein
MYNRHFAARMLGQGLGGMPSSRSCCPVFLEGAMLDIDG